ncbi:Guanine-specific ribonuclease N1/T1 [Penicillium bovifimosum]|uniref:Guanine-specific ribonuclease N1/T1 n=1 Tax=Penicillium bovifimosum TaxID=126998 RepID=A0A9W9GLZ8_9EURO|nr:Guanine-specific ribonuclease N1/T1 [Penicillium bovifimosum]KAJ5123973.1 Guanine-specific ribonuclease N1/T1 [Penicillium bovifimosum]
MIFDFKSIVLYGLVALAHASPVPELSKRAKLSDFQCPDGTTLSEHDIREAYHECRRLNDGSIGKYPFKFGNKSGGAKVFSNIPDGTDLREFPIIEGGTYSGGVPGAYRVVTDYKDNRGDFRGVMQHTGPTMGGAYTACTRVDTKNKDDKKDKKDKRSVQVTDSVDETVDIAEESTDHTASDLATRSKKKKIGSASCPDGATFSKDDVGNAFTELKKNDDYGVGGYPHGFGNMSGNQQVFEGVTRALREYPLLAGATWTGGEPGKYRIVADYNNKFAGVMIESAGASFTRCTVNSD